jgi:hypothetical protein
MISFESLSFVDQENFHISDDSVENMEKEEEEDVGFTGKIRRI